MLQIFENQLSLKSFRQSLLEKGQSLGFVPTMGALHSGHLALIEKAIQENDQVICSIYVNPTQFNNSRDLQKYPRDFENDIAQLKKFECVHVFLPNDQVMYPSPTLLKFDFGYLEHVMEGHFRPGHFNGVALVVSKLFNLVKPHRAYFGQKDLQQTLIVHKLIQDLSFDLELIVCPTIREEDGLAMSSRNRRLSPSERIEARVIPYSLFEAKEMLQSQKGDIASAKALVRKNFENGGLKIEYFEIVDRFTLLPIQNIKDSKEVALCLVAYLGEVRLLDNVIFEV